jgi:hypothetical protein
VIRSFRWIVEDVATALRRFVCALAAGPRCGCGERALTRASAVRAHWRWGTFYDGDAGWSCLECQINDREPQQW